MRSASSRVKPFVKWIGGKTQLLPQLLQHVPEDFDGVYHEPFVGGGALFFALQPQRAHLGDLNWRLVHAYRCVAHELQETIACLRKLERTSDVYYEQRRLLNAEPMWDFSGGFDENLDPEAAARFIYINKACYNGLWRENATGELNTPYGGDRKGLVVDETKLLECSIALRSSADVRCEGFEATEDRAFPGDLVYFDPPYVPVGSTSFTSYTSDGFSVEDHQRLRDVARRMKDRGVHVVLSNSDTPLTRKLYAGFELREVTARRSVNRDGAGRTGARELIIT